MSNLTSVGLVITVLGGTKKVATMTHSNPKAISNWRTSGRFPASTYVPLTQALKRMGLTAQTNLWTMRGSKKKAKR